MKRTLFALAILFCATITYAQTINYGIKAGINLANQTLNSPIFTNDYKHLLGFNAGGFVEIQYNKVILQSGLFYTTKGYREEIGLYDGGQNPLNTQLLNTAIHYLELPLNLLYWNKISSNATIHLGGGPYFAYAISETTDVLNSPYSNISNISVNPKNPDYGLNFLAGIKLKNKYSIDASYGLGLANLGGNVTTLRNTIISLSFGYQFN